MLVIAHLSDTHIGARPEAVDRTRRVLDAILAMRPAPDVLVHTGDVADHGAPDEYEQVRRLHAVWPGPLAICPGNHDVRADYATAFLDGDAGRANRAHAVHDTRFLMLDSLVDAIDGVRQDHGVLGPETLDWLDRELSADAAPAFVCLHHPPAEIGIGLMDPIRLVDSTELADVLRRHAHVRATLVGHAHTMAASTFADRPLLIGGGVVSTVSLDQEDLPEIWYGAPPSFAVHFLHDDGSLTSHWRAVPG